VTPLVRMVVQRHPADCGVAALAMFLGVSYEDALLAIGSDKPTVLKRGVWVTNLTRAAAVLGATLKRKDTWDAEADDGIMWVTSRNWAHVVLLRNGLVWDTDLCCWEPEDYLKAKRAKVRAILVRED
jgi:hypothetical protein